MKGYDILKRAKALLAITDGQSDGFGSELLDKCAPDIINQISCDLKCSPILKLSDEINMDSAKMDAMSYGVAMMLSLINGNTELNRVYTNIYNAKRAAALSGKALIKDNLPNPVVG